MTHVTYNISAYAWLQSRIDDLISDYKDRLAVQIPPAQQDSRPVQIN